MFIKSNISGEKFCWRLLFCPNILQITLFNLITTPALISTHLRDMITSPHIALLACVQKPTGQQNLFSFAKLLYPSLTVSDALLAFIPQGSFNCALIRRKIYFMFLLPFWKNQSHGVLIRNKYGRWMYGPIPIPMISQTFIKFIMGKLTWFLY